MKRIFIAFVMGLTALSLTAGPAVQAATSTGTGGTRAPDENSGIYAALGDSIAAGAGLPSAGGDAQCGRSAQAYPYRVAQKQNLKLVHIACSGATAGDLVSRQGVNGPNISPQLDAAFAGGTPALITITAGANDMGWANFLRKCAQATCGTSLDTTTTDGLRAGYKLKLDYVFSEIQRRSHGQPPRVVITGYSNPISNYCKNRQQYADKNEIKWLNGQRDKLNKTIRDTAKPYKFVRYASMNFDSHSMCARDSWWQDLNAAAPLHPNAKGQDALAKSVNNAARR